MSSGALGAGDPRTATGTATLHPPRRGQPRTRHGGSIMKWFQMRKQRPRDLQSPVQGHKASKWQALNSGPSSCWPKHSLLYELLRSRRPLTGVQAARGNWTQAEQGLSGFCGLSKCLPALPMIPWGRLELEIREQEGVPSVQPRPRGSPLRVEPCRAVTFPGVA